jgi:hypothetical protein
VFVVLTTVVALTAHCSGLWASVLACNRHAQFCCPIPQYLRALRDPSGLPTWLPVALSPDTWASMSNSLNNDLEVCMYPGAPQAQALMLLACVGREVALCHATATGGLLRKPWTYMHLDLTSLLCSSACPSSTVRHGPLSLLAGAVILLRHKLGKDVPADVAEEVGDTAKWLLCGGAQGLEELACRALVQVWVQCLGWGQVVMVTITAACTCLAGNPPRCFWQRGHSSARKLLLLWSDRHCIAGEHATCLPSANTPPTLHATVPSTRPAALLPTNPEMELV